MLKFPHECECTETKPYTPVYDYQRSLDGAQSVDIDIDFRGFRNWVGNNLQSGISDIGNAWDSAVNFVKGWFKKPSQAPVEYANYEGLSSDPLAGPSTNIPPTFFNGGGAISNLGVQRGDLQGNGGGNTGDYLLPKLYLHFQFGGKADFNIDASTLNFSNTSQKELGLTGIKAGESKGVNLFNSGINSNSLAFGKLTFTSQGNNQFSISSNMFDFDYQEGSSFGRNFGTFIGGAVFDQFYTVPVTPYGILRNMTGFGGSFNVIFNGNATVPK